MSHPVQDRMTKNTSCELPRHSCQRTCSASSLGSVPYPAATIFKEHSQVTVCSHRTQTLLALYAREKLGITPIGVLLRIVSIASQQTVRIAREPLLDGRSQHNNSRRANLGSVCKSL